MNWTTYGTVIAAYISFACAALCCWPGLIARRDPVLIRRLLLFVMAFEAFLLCFVLSADLLLITSLQDQPIVDHLRRVVSRWGRTVMCATVLLFLYINTFNKKIQYKLIFNICVALFCFANFTGMSLQTPPLTIMGNTKSHIYYWPKCPNYPKHTSTRTYWKSFASEKDAESAGFRAPLNCRRT